jgi:hypothetical protein
MAPEQNLIDVLLDLKTTIEELRRTMYGDQAARTSGLIAEVDSHRRRIDDMSLEVRQLKERRPIIWLWLCGYVSFVAAWTMAAVGIVNALSRANVWDFPPAAAAMLAIVLTFVAAILFVAGFGWLQK